MPEDQEGQRESAEELKAECEHNNPSIFPKNTCQKWSSFTYLILKFS